MRRAASYSAAVVLAAMVGAVGASPAPPAQDQAASDPVAAARLLDSTAEATIRRLPTCEIAINTRVSEWKASASIACRKSSAAVPACVAAQLTARAGQLKQLRSCRSL
ncbi:MAG: hypothetical protein C0487_04955 [Leptothrix sp. (in: Bacteria)]|nr:hypothetical protein [Leptothrix sp. (in: b-proteobacteria)]